ncbi:MAG: hypothetical protein EOO73_00835 [Myxococcales bacterium]|nr:MAG: hypothetical protein EOO73_00835 [Myxococcales bacterium]
MRVRFGELSAEEAREREALCDEAREVWRQLAAGNSAYACSLLRELDARLELFVDSEGPVRVAELSALESSAWPLAELLLAQAPEDAGCVLSLGRAAVPLARALSEVKATHGVDLERAGLRAGFGRGHLLEVTLGVPGGTGSENEQNAAENLVRSVLGDRVFETWIGAVHVAPAPRFPSLRVLDPRAPRTTLQVQELFDTVAAATLGVLRGLPDTPRAAARSDADDAREELGAVTERDDWTLLEIEPLADERAGRKDDLVLASTCTPELLRCYLDGAPCSSRRFSRVGEQFVFVSYEDTERVMSRRVARRTAIELALADAVAGIGAVTGVGFGVGTSYVDLALHHPETGLGSVVKTLRTLDVPAATFIQFFDSELAEEWLAIWPDSRLSDA